jgi:hypothetical protein
MSANSEGVAIVGERRNTKSYVRGSRTAMRRIDVGLLSQGIVAEHTRRSMFPALQHILSLRPAPDVLLCAGYTFGTLRELRQVCSATEHVPTLIVAEANVRGEKRKGSLCWIYRGRAIRVGEQQMFKSSDPQELAHEALRAWRLREAKNPKRDLRILWINCGEIFVFKGGVAEVSIRYEATRDVASDIVNSADIVVHPTHDRMIRRFVVDRIAAALTIGRVIGLKGRYPLAYVHASNWSAHMGQRQNRTALHKAFVNGREIVVHPIRLPSVLSSRFLFSRMGVRLP